MAQAVARANNAIAVDAVVAFIKYSEYEGYTIIVPEQFSSDDSDLLMKLQVQAINAGAVFSVQRDTLVHLGAWTFEIPPRACVHVNFSPVARKDFPYSVFSPLTLVEKDGFVFAGVCLITTTTCFSLRDCLYFFSLRLDSQYVSLLERFNLRSTALVHHDRQSTFTPPSSTSSTTCSPPKSTATTAASGKRRDVLKRRWDEYLVTASGPKHSHTDPTNDLTSEPAPIQPPMPAVLIVPVIEKTDDDRTDINHEPTTNTKKLPQSSSKTDIIENLKLDEDTHCLLLIEANKVRDSIRQRLSNPFWKDLSWKVKHKATSTMVNKASVKTRSFYAKGKWVNNGIDENWVALWYLYRSFRHKDNRRPRSNKAEAAATQDSARDDYQLSIEDIQGGDHFPDTVAR